VVSESRHATRGNFGVNQLGVPGAGGNADNNSYCIRPAWRED